MLLSFLQCFISIIFSCVFTDIEDVADVKNPLDDVTAGLLTSGDQCVPLKSVHVRAKLLDLAASVSVCCSSATLP